MDENNDSQLNISNKDNEDDKKEIEKSKVIEIIEETVIEEDEESLFAFVGQKAPIFKEISWSGSHYKMVNLKDYIGKYIILKFYDKNFTNQTIEEINLYADNYENLKKLSKSMLFKNIYIIIYIIFYFIKIVNAYLSPLSQNTLIRSLLLF